jgi:4'-phosphopantetheinyl transferase
VWSFDLTDDDLRDEAALAVLDEGERARRQRFLREETRVRFTAAHAGLRFVLAEWIGARPADLRFGRGRCPNCGDSHGRPQLEGVTDLHFNLSHSRDVAYVAICDGASVGIDVEFMRSNLDDDRLSERFFAPSERSTLQSLPASKRMAAFYRLWVRKEAVLKGSGHGLSGGLAIPAGDIHERSVTLAGADAGQWFVTDLEAPPGHAAAVAVARPAPVLRHRWRGRSLPSQSTEPI